MHIPPAQVPKIKNQINDIDDSTFPPIIVLNTSMEKVSINDTLAFTNHMPELQVKMTDTVFIINTPINIQIPPIFKDIDANDSLTYFASGLPKWVSFDSTTMKLSGSGDKAGSYMIKISAKDKSLCTNSSSFKLVISDPTSINYDKNQKTSFFYPNPATDKLYIKNVKSSKAFVQIHDLSGKLVLNNCLNDNTLDISNLKKGIYTVKFIDSGNILIYKLIKN